MVALAFYLGGVVVFAIGALLMRGTSSLGRLGGRKYERRKRRKLIGQTLMASALLPVGVGALHQAFPETLPADVSDTVTAPDNNRAPSLSTAPAMNSISATTSAPATNSASANSSQGTNQAPALAFTQHQGELVSGDAPEMAAINIGSQTNVASGSTLASPADSARYFHEALELYGQANKNAALAKVTAAIEADPKNRDAYGLRGSIYAQEKYWDRASKDYQAALQLDPNNLRLKMNLATIAFEEKKYDAARSSFAEAEQDQDVGDFAKYMVFICNLAAGHVDVATKELDEFNQVGSNASYYFSNAAWSVYHQKDDDAANWLASASRIYPQAKFKTYLDGVRIFYKGSPPAEAPAVLPIPTAQ